MRPLRDAASLTLIEDLLTHPDTRYLLLIGAYRDNAFAWNGNWPVSMRKSNTPTE
jgi:hypothetical protein